VVIVCNFITPLNILGSRYRGPDRISASAGLSSRKARNRCVALPENKRDLGATTINASDENKRKEREREREGGGRGRASAYRYYVSAPFKKT
jgi:hypothetical protein